MDNQEVHKIQFHEKMKNLCAKGKLIIKDQPGSMNARPKDLYDEEAEDHFAKLFIKGDKIPMDSSDALTWSNLKRDYLKRIIPINELKAFVKAKSLAYAKYNQLKGTVNVNDAVNADAKDLFPSARSSYHKQRTGR